MKKIIKNSSGFSLIAIAIILVIAGIIAAGLIGELSDSNAKKLKITEERIADITKALEAYNIKSSDNKYPCPAGRSLAEDNSNYGKSQSACAGTIEASDESAIKIGTVPTRDLNLTDDHMIDGWGNRFVYAIDVNQATGGAANTNALLVTRSGGSDLSASYFLYSAGSGEFGAYDKRGSGPDKDCTDSPSNDEKENCDADKTFVLSDRYKKITATNFTQITYAAIYAPVAPNNLILWLDASDLDGKFDGITGAPADSAAITIWKDKSGKSNDASGGVSPTYAASVAGIDSKPAVTFDGTSQQLINASLKGKTISTIIAVARQEVAAGASKRIFNGGSGDNTVFFGSKAGNFATFFGDGTTWNDETANVVNKSIAHATNFKVLSVVNTGASATPYVDSVAQTAKTGTTIAYTGYILGNGTGSENFNGQIAEIIVYNRVLSPKERNLVEKKLMAKYNIVPVAGDVCGDSVVSGAEECDGGASCSGSCTWDAVCGDNHIAYSAGEQCDDGATVDGDGCSATCQGEVCGDGIQNGAEQCDDGGTANNDGCNSVCVNEVCGDNVVNYSSHGFEECDYLSGGEDASCDTYCMFKANCGDGNVALVSGETCDDGGTSDNDGCNATCHTEYCGDGVINWSSNYHSGPMSNIDICDDGNTSDGDGCSSVCETEASSCSNGILEAWGGETCDDGNWSPNDGCDSACHTETANCGNGTTEAWGGEQCDDWSWANGNGFSSCTATCQTNVCGDNYLYTYEQCDDGNVLDNDGCSSTCNTETASCGNGVLEVWGGEQCDDGGVVPYDGCDSTCLTETPVCGNAHTEAGETCDDGSLWNNDGCNSTCQIEYCGDGVVNYSLTYIRVDTCDDGNTDNGDGCSQACETETPVCGNSIIEGWGGETCDDGNNISYDGCSSACVAESAVCGNGIVESGETCDDGNTTDDGNMCYSWCQCVTYFEWNGTVCTPTICPGGYPADADCGCTGYYDIGSYTCVPY